MKLITKARSIIEPLPLGEAREACPDDAPKSDRIGICCSGGGIRSAAYCLGALQVLREEDLLPRAEYLSAVSGGSYIASAFASAAARADRLDAVPVFAPGSVEEEHLRNHSSYMAPDAAGKVLLVLRIVGGALWHLLLLASLCVLVFGPISRGYRRVSEQLAGHSGGFVLNHLGWCLLATAVLLGLAVALMTEVWEADNRRPMAELVAWYAVLAAGGVALLVVIVPQGVLAGRALGHISFPTKSAHGAADASRLLGFLGGTAAVTAIWGALSTFVSQRRRILLHLAAFVAGPAIVLTFILLVVNAGAATDWHWWLLAVWLGAAALLTFVWFKGDLTQWSLHPFYRRRLSSAFYTQRELKPDAPPRAVPTRDLLWTDLASTQKARDDGHRKDRFPKLVVCAAANINKPGETPPGRAAMPFVFSGTRVGVPRFHSKLPDYARSATLTVPESVAMSGAAVSPLMGKKTIHAVRFLMGLMNVRLGVWVPNPRPGVKPTTVRPRPHLLIRELVGLSRVTDPWIYVTDGGHFDNLGLVELLRRGCGTVFCLDGGGDAPGSFRALGEAVALARSELQVDVEVDPTPITPSDGGIAERGYVLGSLRFRVSPAGEPLTTDNTGRIIYCRSAVTEDAPADVRDFARRDKRFPFHSTMDQLFTDEKFESYRALGAHTARVAIAAWRRQALRDTVVEILHEKAREKAWVGHADLVRRVRSAMQMAELQTLRPLLDEIAAEELKAKRPAIAILVQDDSPGGDVLAEIQAVYRASELVSST